MNSTLSIIEYLYCASLAADADYQSNEISVYTEHVSNEDLEKYKRMAMEAESADKVLANSIMLPSGREALRGKENNFGELNPPKQK